jgi:hypothetical protein
MAKPGRNRKRRQLPDGLHVDAFGDRIDLTRGPGPGEVPTTARALCEVGYADFGGTCPLCTGRLPRTPSGRLGSAEDVPPHAVGGTVRTRTCPDCNGLAPRLKPTFAHLQGLPAGRRCLPGSLVAPCLWAQVDVDFRRARERRASSSLCARRQPLGGRRMLPVSAPQPFQEPRCTPSHDRGLRTSAGPGIARVHVGAGRTGLSTGAGPVGFYTRAGGSRRAGSASQGSAAAALDNSTLRTGLRRWKNWRRLLLKILRLHRQELPTSHPPIAAVPGWAQ